MHIYQDRNQEFRFVDECRNGGVGIGLEELKHFVTNYKQYCDMNKHAYVPAYSASLGTRFPSTSQMKTLLRRTFQVKKK